MRWAMQVARMERAECIKGFRGKAIREETRTKTYMEVAG
jgi:hypothetical protein